MGYDRERGGLGKTGQGIVEPVVPAAVVNHASEATGLGANSLTDVSTTSDFESFRANAASQFNSTVGVRNKSKKSKQPEVKAPVEETCMFEFLNTFEAKDHQRSNSVHVHSLTLGVQKKKKREQMASKKLF
jgi:hypothetical protein